MASAMIAGRAAKVAEDEITSGSGATEPSGVAALLVQSSPAHSKSQVHVPVKRSQCLRWE
jgi:hypothetical protein